MSKIDFEIGTPINTASEPPLSQEDKRFYDELRMELMERA